MGNITKHHHLAEFLHHLKFNRVLHHYRIMKSSSQIAGKSLIYSMIVKRRRNGVLKPSKTSSISFQKKRSPSLFWTNVQRAVSKRTKPKLSFRQARKIQKFDQLKVPKTKLS